MLIREALNEAHARFSLSSANRAATLDDVAGAMSLDPDDLILGCDVASASAMIALDRLMESSPDGELAEMLGGLFGDVWLMGLVQGLLVGGGQ